MTRGSIIPYGLPDEVTHGLEAYLARAMLLGMEYDPRDHTMCEDVGERYVLFDADTMEPVQHNQFEHRRGLVESRELGPEWLARMEYGDRYQIWVSQSPGNRI